MSILKKPPGSPLFPYTTLFRSMLPGMLAATVLSDQLAAALEDPSRVSWWLVAAAVAAFGRSEEHTSELQSRRDLVCRLLLEKKNSGARSGRPQPSRGTKVNRNV